jgi:hypothetical protein
MKPKITKRLVRRAPVDKNAAEELVLYTTSDSRFYKGIKATERMLAKRMRAGTYDKAKAPKAYLWVLNHSAKEYRKEPIENPPTFNLPTREEAAKELARYFEVEYAIRPGDYK